MFASRFVWRGWFFWLVAALASLAPPLTWSQDFRIDTEIFVGQDKEPKLQTLTIFADGRVYDFLQTEPRQITIFDPLRGQFTLLDESRRIKAAVTTKELLASMLELETRAAEKKERLLAFIKPQFEITSEDVTENGQSLVRVKLSSKSLEYAVLGQQPQRPEAVAVYRNFADWYARLNATLPGNLPAGARLPLNEALAERKLLPLEVTRTVTLMGALGKKTDVVRSQHRVNWVIAGKDRSEMERAGDYVTIFEPVAYNEYRSLPANTVSAKQARR
jgi:hypothetical protein